MFGPADVFKHDVGNVERSDPRTVVVRLARWIAT